MIAAALEADDDAGQSCRAESEKISQALSRLVGIAKFHSPEFGDAVQASPLELPGGKLVAWGLIRLEGTSH